jgi:Flp pilus assembly protein TadG
MKPRTDSLRVEHWGAGQALVEFAIVASVFLLTLFAIMSLGLGVYKYNTLCSAAREAVRYAIVHGPTSLSPSTTAQIQQIAINQAPGLNLKASDITVSFPADPNSSSTQKDAKVQISYNYSPPIPFMPQITLTLTSTAQMLVSQ